jgi:hypothetical protein
VGFSNSQLTPLNYTSPDPNDNFIFELSFRPIFKVEGDILDVVQGFTAEVYVDVPKLDIAVSQVENVTRDCKPANAGTPSNQIFHNLTYVVPTVSFDVGFNSSIFTADLLAGSIPVGTNYTLPTSCLDFLPKTHALGTVPGSSDGVRMQSPLAAIWAMIILSMLCLF